MEETCNCIVKGDQEGNHIVIDVVDVGGHTEGRVPGAHESEPLLGGTRLVGFQPATHQEDAAPRRALDIFTRVEHGVGKLLGDVILYPGHVGLIRLGIRLNSHNL